MNNFNFWDSKLALDDYIFEISNIVYRIIYRFKYNSKILKRNADIKESLKGKEAFIVLNGPSLNEQNLKPLKDKILFFVNRGYLHEDYALLSPNFHAIIDGKLATGEWDIGMIDEIFKLNPNVNLMLNAKWSKLKKFEFLRGNNSVYWIDSDLFFTRFYNGDLTITRPTPGKAVFGACLVTAIYSGIRDIKFIGLDATGLPHELLKNSSHFYGINEDNKNKDTKDFIKDLYMMSCGLKTFHAIAKYCRKKGISIINMTQGGLLDMFERQPYPYPKGEKTHA